MVLRLIRDLPGDEFLLPPSPRGLDDISYPGWADDASARLDISNGCQDHTISPYATMPLVLRVCRSLTIVSPCDPVSRATLPRPPHPVPNVRDDSRSAPLAGQDGKSCKSDLGRSRSDLFFATGLDRNSPTLPVGQITWRKKCRKRLRRSAFLSRP